MGRKLIVGGLVVAGVAAAVGHAVAASAVLFGADLPPTGADPAAWPSPVVAVSKALLWATMIGWILALRPRSPRTPNPTLPEGDTPLLSGR